MRRFILLFAILLVLGPSLQARGRGFVPYSCITWHYDTDKWIECAPHKFDSSGILMHHDTYFPLSIAILGILRYEDFLRDGDSADYRQMVAQYNYFKDPRRTMPKFGGRGLGLPYLRSFKDMRAPWFSGMTQGVAISFLLRYVDLTGDTTALPIVRKIAFLMLQHEAIGGTMGVTPEGEWWIEEYPNSHKSPQVMNGFINALIGLHEYCAWFPEDRLARERHDACFRTLLRSFHLYDRPRTTDYSRGNLLPIPPNYFNYQVQQMEHLTALYHDERLARQWMLWAKFAMENVDTGAHYYRNPTFKFMSPIYQVTEGEGWARDFDFAAATVPGTDVFYSSFASAGARIYPPIRLSMHLELHMQQPLHFLQVIADRPILSESLTVRALDSRDRPLDTEWVVEGSTLSVISVNAFERINLMSMQGLEVLETRQLSASQLSVPRFLLLEQQKAVYLSKGCRYHFECAADQVADMQLFFKWGPSVAGLKDTLWRFEHVIDWDEGGFVAPADAFYQGFVVIPVQMPHPRIRRWRLVAD